MKEHIISQLNELDIEWTELPANEEEFRERTAEWANEDQGHMDQNAFAGVMAKIVGSYDWKLNLCEFYDIWVTFNQYLSSRLEKFHETR